MTSTLLLARRHVTFSMSPESDETFYIYREPGSCPGFPPCLISDPPRKGAVLNMLIKWCFKSVLISMKSPNIESREEISTWERFRSFTNYEDNSTLALPSPSSNEVKFVTSCTLIFFLYIHHCILIIIFYSIRKER